MAASSGFLGIGTTVTVGAQSWQIIDVDGGGGEREAVETTHQGSTEWWKERLPGMCDAGQISCRVVHVPGAPFTYNSGVGTVTIAWPTSPAGPGGSFSCSGFVQSLKPSTPKGQMSTAQVVIALSGKPTWS